MLNLPTEMITAAAADDAWPIDLIEIVPGNLVPVRMCTHYRDLTSKGSYIPAGETEVESSNFNAVASVMAIGTVPDDLEIKEGGITVQFTGLNPTVIATLTEGLPIKGSPVSVHRGFINSTTGELVSGLIPGTSTTVNSYQRWAGYIKLYTIKDTYQGTNSDKVTVSMGCTSNLSNALDSEGGVFQSLASHQEAFPGDTSMEFVAQTVNTVLNFFKIPPSDKHLCTVYHGFGDITDEVFRADSLYAMTEVDDKLHDWYSSWALPLAESIEKGTVKYYIVKPFVIAWANSMAYKMGMINKRSYFGEFLEWFGTKLSR